MGPARRPLVRLRWPLLVRALFLRLPVSSACTRLLQVPKLRLDLDLPLGLRQLQVSTWLCGISSNMMPAQDQLSYEAIPKLPPPTH